MSRDTNSHNYCPQQIGAMSACFGLTQSDLESGYNTLVSFLSFLFLSFFPIDLRPTCGCVVISITRYFCRISLIFIILLYRRYHCQEILSRRSLLLCIIAVNPWRTQDEIFKTMPIFCYTVINQLPAHAMHWPAATTTISRQRSSCNHTTKRSKHFYLDNRTYVQKCIHVSFVGINIHGISVGYLLCGPERQNSRSWTNIYRNDSLERRWQINTDEAFFLVLRFLKATPFFEFDFFFLRSGLFCGVLVPGTLPFHLLDTLLVNYDCLVYSCLTVCDHVIIS